MAINKLQIGKLGKILKSDTKMKYKVDKYIPMPRFHSPFVEALYKLNVGESIGNLTRKQVYKHRQNFYRPDFAPRKFRFRQEDNRRWRIWRVE
jgi:hypothetical protein